MNAFPKIKRVLLLVIALTGGLPQAGLLMAQVQTDKNPVSVKQLSLIPAVQNVIADSLSAKYGFKNTAGIPALFSAFDTSNNQYHKNLYQYIQQKVGIKKWEDIKQNIFKFNPGTKEAQQLSSLLPGLFALKNTGSLQKYNPFTGVSIKLNQMELSGAVGQQFGVQRNYVSGINIAGEVNIAGVPMGGKLQTGYPLFFNQQPAAMFKFSFDKEGFQNKLRNSLNQQFDLKKYTLSGFDFEKILKGYASSITENLEQEFSGIKELLPFVSNLKNLSAEEILYFTADQLEEKVFVTALNNQMSHELTATPDSLKTVAQDFKNKLRSFKENFGKKGININAVMRYQQAINKNIDSLTNTSGFITSTAKELLPLSGFSRFFTKMKSFNLGQFSSAWSEKTLSGIFMSGISGDFKAKQLFAGTAIFENKPLAAIKDNQFSRVLDNPNQFVQALRIGNGELTGNHTHITAANSKTFNRNWTGNNQLLTLPRNNLAGTISNKTDLGKGGVVSTELSKTSSSYQNNVTGIDGQITEAASALSGFTQDFWQTVSLGVSYQNQYKKIELEHQFTFNYSGLGYSNPGNGFNARGVLQVGAVIKKNLYKNKGNIQVRYQRRNNYTGTEKTSFFKQDRLNISTKWKFSKQLKAGFSWNSTIMQRVEDKKKSTLFNQTRGSFDASYNGKIKNTPLLQFVTAGYQHFSFTGNTGELPGKMFVINSATNLSFRKTQLQVNLQLLQDASPINEQNSLFTSDAGFGFAVTKSLQMTNSLTWLSQTDRVRQLGIRSTINGQIGKRWQVSLFGDLRKNLVENLNPLFFPSVRGEIMIQYIIQ